MDFYEMLDHALALLRQRGRVTYRALKVQFHLDDEQLDALKEELLYAHRGLLKRMGRVWSGVGCPEHTGPGIGRHKGQQTPETTRTYARACALGRQVGDTLQRSPALYGFWSAQMATGQLPQAWELGGGVPQAGPAAARSPAPGGGAPHPVGRGLWPS